MNSPFAFKTVGARARYYNKAFAPMPVKDMVEYLNKGTPVVYVDTETSGLGLDHRIVELSAIKVNNPLSFDENAGDTEVFSSRFNPRRGIDPRSHEIHGLRLSDLRNEPWFEDHAEELLSFFDGCVLVAHNANFDLTFIAMEVARANAAQPEGSEGRMMFRNFVRGVRFFDSQKLHATMGDNKPENKTLDAMSAASGVAGERRVHTALGDAILLANMCRELFKPLCSQKGNA